MAMPKRKRDEAAELAIAAAQIQASQTQRKLKAEADRWRQHCNILQEQLELEQARTEVALDIARDSMRPRPIPKISGKSDATAVLVLSDWHWGERVDPSTVNGLNEFNPQIAHERAVRVFQGAVRVIEVARKLCQIDTLVVALLGDFITGYIHEELRKSNHLSPVQEVLAVQDEIYDGVAFLKKNAGCSRIVVPTCFGNHGRTTQKWEFSTAHLNSYEWMMYHTLRKHLGALRGVEMEVGNSYLQTLEIQGRKVRFHHGNGIRYQGGVGGITIPVNKAIARWNTQDRVDHDIFGHFHQSQAGSRWTCNGSLIGHSAFAMQNGFEFEPPKQRLVVISRKRGVTANFEIFAEA